MPGRELARLSETSKNRLRQRVEEAGGLLVFTDNYEEAVREIVDTDILFGFITPEILEKARQLKWIQAPMSSMGTPRGEYYIFPTLQESDVVLTNMSGIYSDVISTHVFAFITSFARDFPTLFRNQHDQVWGRNTRTMNLRGTTLGVVGLGGIGKAVARLGDAFGMHVVAVDPHPRDVPQFVQQIWPPEQLTQLLRVSDFVVLCLPAAPGTENLIDAEALAAMKPTAYLINIGRGITVDLDALTQALQDQAIAGVGLDVFPPALEPLPSDHPLWTMNNVIITPHCAGSATPSDRRINVFLDNFGRYLRGEPLLNRVDKMSMIRDGAGYDLPTN
ncbi:MAG: D-2-hydroxyacid dehydrogenase [Candidatus Bathyarchaeota archaeon]|nr:D-2-hydroxyacid dehydrogenase [Candidatus Bathyarchaeota archaeon]